MEQLYPLVKDAVGPSKRRDPGVIRGVQTRKQDLRPEFVKQPVLLR